jgi:hypothetical protein
MTASGDRGGVDLLAVLGLLILIAMAAIAFRLGWDVAGWWVTA